jgi:YfiH family protein
MAFHEKDVAGVRYLYSDLLPCPHGFSTKIGGVSTLAHLQSMNLGDNRGDDPQNVKENYRRFAFATGLPQKKVFAHQVHENTVLYVTKEQTGQPSCDGFYTDKEDLALYVKIADCIPILLYAPDLPAVAALHAGWRGTAAGIAREGVKKLVALGADPEKMRAAIGVGIGSCCYEVDDPFIKAFLSSLGPEFDRFLERRPEGTFADLKGANRELLLRSGLKKEHIDLCPRCTKCENQLFFSHRHTGGARGTMAAGIALPSKRT